MLRKIYNYITSAVIIILVLVIILISQTNNKNEKDYGDWINSNNSYITTVAEVGDVKKSITNYSYVDLNSAKFTSYILDMTKIRDNIREGSIIQPGEYLDNDSTVKIDYLGRVESINNINNSIEVVVGNFKYLFSIISLEEKYSRDIKIGDSVEVFIDDIKLQGKIVNHAYNIVDGFLLIDVEYESQKCIFTGSKVEVDILIDFRESVLRIDKSAIIVENGEYFVNVIEDNIVNKIKVDIGLYGDEYVEIKKGLKEGTVVVLNQYV